MTVSRLKPSVPDDADSSDGYASLRRALSDVAQSGRTSRLARWLDVELDADGVPRRLPASDWLRSLVALAEARRGLGRGWPTLFDARLDGLFLHTLRFSRPDGSTVFGPESVAPEAVAALRYWADHLGEPGYKTVLDWWFPARRSRHASPPLPAASRDDRPLAVLRADWSASGDLLAIDHRGPGVESRVELVGLGRRWLGPGWTAGDGPTPDSRARPALWLTNSSFDLLEWSFRSGPSRHLRTALLLRGRRLALLADQVEGAQGRASMRIGHREGLAVAASPEDRSLVLTSGPRRPSARLIPLAVPFRASTAERGSFTAERGELLLEQPIEGRRVWVPLLASWEPLRARKRLLWRSLTVTEGGRVCAPETAVAFRVAWGRDESLVIYRSLARPAARVFLGHRTTARFLVGLFSREGEVEPIVDVEA